MRTLFTMILGVIVVAGLLAVAGVLGRLPSKSTSEPPKWESSFAMRALDASLEKRSAGLKNPIAANDAAALAAGKKIYADNCAGCHGDVKGPSGWGSHDLYPRAPQFFQEGVDVTAPEAFAAIHDGIRYSGMGAWGDQMKDDEIWKVANFVATIKAPGGKMKMDKD